VKKGVNYLGRYLLIFAIALFVGLNLLPSPSFAHINAEDALVATEDNLDVLDYHEETLDYATESLSKRLCELTPGGEIVYCEEVPYYYFGARDLSILAPGEEILHYGVENPHYYFGERDLSILAPGEEILHYGVEN